MIQFWNVLFKFIHYTSQPFRHKNLQANYLHETGKNSITSRKMTELQVDGNRDRWSENDEISNEFELFHLWFQPNHGRICNYNCV